MKFPTSTSVLIRVIGSLALLWHQFNIPASAEDNWELGKSLYTSNACASCHSSASNNILMAGYGKTDISNAIATQPLMSQFRSLTATQISDLGAYLGKTSFPIAEITAITTSDFGSIAVDSTASRSFQIRNRGDAILQTNSVSVDDSENYTAAPNCVNAAVSPGGACTFQVTFAPRSVAEFNLRKLTVGHNAFGDGASNPVTPPQRKSSLTLSGTGLDPFTVTPNSVLSFTGSTVPPGIRTVTINDNRGDRIKVCRSVAGDFSAPTDFFLDSPGTFDAGGCFTSATGAVPRQIPLVIRFAASEPGPRFANLTFQRLDNASNPTGPVTTLRLQGNPGGFATLDASRLFDAIEDRGVEVDGDDTLTRSVTIFSEGSAPLPFTSSTFTIAGPSSNEYTVAGTGCKALTQLPASTAGLEPSCVLTVIFNPSDVGRRGPATLMIRIAGTTDNVVALNGLGFRGPRLTVRRGVTPLASGDTVQFGAQTVGGAYPPILVTLTNGGTQGGMDVVLPAAGSTPGFSFTDAANCRQLAPGAACSIALRFNPANAQAYATSFAIQTRPAGTNDPFKTFELDLKGQGSASAIPTLSWTDGSGTPIFQLAFADTAAGSPTTTRVRLYNAGPGGARLRFGNAIGSDSVDFSLDTSGCKDGLDLFEGMSCDVAVTFAPGVAGRKSASVQFVAEAGTPPVAVVAPYLAMTGASRASASPALLRPSASTIEFSTTVVGSSSAPAELRLANQGGAALTVLNLGTDTPFSVQTRTCAAVPFVLLPGAECAVSITFNPQAEGGASGKLRIATDATSAAQEITLNGTGQPRADVSGGGCSMVSGDTLADPTLWALALLAIAALVYRSRARTVPRQRP